MQARIETNCPVPLEIRDKFKSERVELEEKMIQCIKRIIEGNFSDIAEFFSVKKSNEMIEALEHIESEIAELKKAKKKFAEGK